MVLGTRCTRLVGTATRETDVKRENEEVHETYNISGTECTGSVKCTGQCARELYAVWGREHEKRKVYGTAHQKCRGYEQSARETTSKKPKKYMRGLHEKCRECMEQNSREV